MLRRSPCSIPVRPPCTSPATPPMSPTPTAGGLDDAKRAEDGYTPLTRFWHMDRQTAEVRAAYDAARNGQLLRPGPDTRRFQAKCLVTWTPPF